MQLCQIVIIQGLSIVFKIIKLYKILRLSNSVILMIQCKISKLFIQHYLSKFSPRLFIAFTTKLCIDANSSLCIK